MKRTLLSLSLGTLLPLSEAALATEEATTASTEHPSQQVTKASEQDSFTGPADFFTGQANVDMVWRNGEEINVSGGVVTFAPKARSAWHTHPAGQHLWVLSGTGLTQEWGKPIQVIEAGDVVWCPPGVKHWHGASATSEMKHLAITGVDNGKNVEWMEKVTDDEYNAR